jgi:hypothetical protein
MARAGRGCSLTRAFTRAEDTVWLESFMSAVMQTPYLPAMAGYQSKVIQLTNHQTYIGRQPIQVSIEAMV